MKRILPMLVIALWLAVAAHAATGAPEKQYLYCSDFGTGSLFKVDPDTGAAVVYAGGNVGISFDSKGNLYNQSSRFAPGGGAGIVYLTGVMNPMPLTIDSYDNLYIAEYINHYGRVWKIPLKSLTDDMLPIKFTYLDKEAKIEPIITPRGIATVMQDHQTWLYGLTADAFGNVYSQPLSDGPFYKYHPSGKVTEVGHSGPWPRTTTIDANGDFYNIGFYITKISKNGDRIGMFAPGIDFNHSMGLTFDNQGNLYQTNGAPGHTREEQMGHGIVFKYTPDGRRIVLNDHIGLCPAFIVTWPRTQFPLKDPAKDPEMQEKQ